VRCALGDLDDEIPHSGPRIHLESLIPPTNAALAVVIDADPEDPGFVTVEIEGRGPNTGTIREVETGAVVASSGLRKAAVLGEGVGGREIGFGDELGEGKRVSGGASISANASTSTSASNGAIARTGPTSTGYGTCLSPRRSASSCGGPGT